MKILGKKYFFLLMIALIFMVYSAVKFYKSYIISVKTELAECSLTQNIIETDGFAVRDEEVIDWNGIGKISYEVKDGEKVSGGGVISYIYDNGEEACRENEIRNIEKEVNMLYDLNKTMVCDLKKPNIIDKEIDENILDMEKSLINNSFDDAFKRKNRFVRLMSEKKKFLGNDLSLSERIDMLLSRKQNLEAMSKGKKQSVVSPNAGWFSSFVDGYEKAFNYNDIKNCRDTNFSLNDVIKKERPQYCIGKILHSCECYIICSIPKPNADEIKVGNEYELKLPSMVSRGIPCKVYDLKEDGSNKINLIISCDYIDSEILRFRKGKIKIKLNEYYGFKVKKSAVCYKDENNGSETFKFTGVNIKFGNIITFKRAKIIYSDNDYVILSPNSDDDNKSVPYLRIGDRIVVEGMDLYDGKFIKC